MVIDVLTLLFAGIAAIAALLGYLRSVAQGRTAGLRVERQGRDHVVICGGPGQATDVRIEFTSGGPISHGELERPRMMPGEVFRIGTFMPSSQDVVPEEVTIRWREGRRNRSLVAQIL